MLFENVRELAKKKGMSVGELEKAAGLSNGAIFKWRVSSPKVDSVQAVAKALLITLVSAMKRGSLVHCMIYRGKESPFVSQSIRKRLSRHYRLILKYPKAYISVWVKILNI